MKLAICLSIKNLAEAHQSVRNKLIVDSADFVLAFWDGKSKGTKSVIEYCKKQGKPYEVRLVNSKNK